MIPTSIHLSIESSMYLCNYYFIFPSIQPSIYIYINLSIHISSVHPSSYPYVQIYLSYNIDLNEPRWEHIDDPCRLLLTTGVIVVGGVDGGIGRVAAHHFTMAYTQGAYSGQWYSSAQFTK